MKKFGVIAVLAALISLAGCVDSIDVQDGRVPDNLMAGALKWVGRYSGRFEGVATQVTIQFNGNKPFVSTTGDLVGTGCNSRIGDLLRISFENGDNGSAATVADLTFALDSGLCTPDVEGRTVRIRGSLNDDGSVSRIHLSYLLRTELRPLPTTCSVVCSGPHGPCNTVCHSGGYDTVEIYATGAMDRSN